MKVVILAGGLGTRLSEVTSLVPKPMVEVGGKPIIWHIMKIYSSYGFNEFIICLGYRGYLIKEYFANYYTHESDISISLGKNTSTVLNTSAEPWKITLIDTGAETMTAGRVKRIEKYTEGQPFMLTYGDGVGAVDIHRLIETHKTAKKYMTVTSIQPTGRFGGLHIEDSGEIKPPAEKQGEDVAWINGGFFVCEPEVFSYIQGDTVMLEGIPMEHLARDGQMAAYKHTGFWKPMDTINDKNYLEGLWRSGNAPWKVW